MGTRIHAIPGEGWRYRDRRGDAGAAHHPAEPQPGPWPRQCRDRRPPVGAEMETEGREKSG
ncbi:hypothetical protein [Amycolatopsis aidingensis]|uniref:hypothetical protein n=1 Tax=Amycolatopsis aidingensis TaxID=2842453 RepID=UPI001C0C50FF|nr:hypothetical protein [Amycolatopsis aidingensis]